MGKRSRPREAQKKAPKGVQSGCKGVRSDLQRITLLRNARGAREALGLSEHGLGIALAQRVPGRLKAYSKSTINGWERHRNPMTEEVRKAYGVLLATLLTKRLQRFVGVTLDIHSRRGWRVGVWTQCGLCRQWFQLRRLKWKRCEKCRRRGRPKGIDVSF